VKGLAAVRWYQVRNLQLERCVSPDLDAGAGEEAGRSGMVPGYKSAALGLD